MIRSQRSGFAQVNPAQEITDIHLDPHKSNYLVKGDVIYESHPDTGSIKNIVKGRGIIKTIFTTAKHLCFIHDDSLSIIGFGTNIETIIDKVFDASRANKDTICLISLKGNIIFVFIDLFRSTFNLINLGNRLPNARFPQSHIFDPNSFKRAKNARKISA